MLLLHRHDGVLTCAFPMYSQLHDFQLVSLGLALYQTSGSGMKLTLEFKSTYRKSNHLDLDRKESLELIFNYVWTCLCMDHIREIMKICLKIWHNKM